MAPNLNLLDPALVGVAGSAGGGDTMWQELGREAYEGSGTASLSVSGLTDMPYYMILYHTVPLGSISINARINGIDSEDYSNYTAYNGGGGATVGDDRLMFPSGTGAAYDGFGVGYLQNKSTEEKLFVGSTNTRMQATSAYAPNTYETVGKWAETLNPVDEFEIFNSYGTLLIGASSELIVLGADPSTTVTDGGFWEELDTVTVGTPTDSVTTNTFTAKKYLWIVCNVKINTAYFHLRGKFNGIGTSTYSDLLSENGGSYGAQTGQSRFTVNAGSYASDMISFFVVNDTNYEKLMIGEESGLGTGDDSSDAPNKSEWVAKWTDTGTQIVNFTLFNSDTGTTNAIADGTKITVWGSD